MTAEVFVDTNVFLYSIDEDPASAEKRHRAQQILLAEPWCWSVQVAAEFFVNAISPKRPFRLTSANARTLIESWLLMPTLAITPALCRGAMEAHQRYGISYWDAAIIAAAKAMGCPTIYSEDLNNGQIYDGVTVVNPFHPPTT